MKLTPTQMKIIQHRLEVTDAITSVLDVEEDEVERIAGLIRGCFEKCEGYLTTALIFSGDPALTQSILIDCLKGSTYFAAMADAVEHGEVMQVTYKQHYAQAQALADRFAAEGWCQPFEVPAL